MWLDAVCLLINAFMDPVNTTTAGTRSVMLKRKGGLQTDETPVSCRRYDWRASGEFVELHGAVGNVPVVGLAPEPLSGKSGDERAPRTRRPLSVWAQPSSDFASPCVELISHLKATLVRLLSNKFARPIDEQPGPLSVGSLENRLP